MKRALIAAGLSFFTAILQGQQQASNVPPVPDYVPANALHSVIMMSGSKAGDEFVWKSDDGKLHTFSQFNDRGRGPKIDGLYSLNEKGLPTHSAFTGNDYMKVKVDERFDFDGKQSAWKSSAEDGNSPGLSGFYASNSGPAEEIAMVVRAGMANGGALPLLPVGLAHVEKVRSETAELDGKPIEVTLYSISGFGFAPARVWLDKDQQFFATPGTWLAQVRAGGEASLPKLLAIEQELDKSRATDLAHKLIQTPKDGIFIHDVALFDSLNAKVVPPSSSRRCNDGGRTVAVGRGSRNSKLHRVGRLPGRVGEQ